MSLLTEVHNVPAAAGQNRGKKEGSLEINGNLRNSDVNISKIRVGQENAHLKGIF